MKKTWFKVLCMVLVVALLAPNVFAATPAPEAPLADEATVTRVKNEIATGQITDMEDLFLVAYQHLGADINKDGMTAYINEDGTLGFTQIISSNSNGDVSLCATNGGVEEKMIAVMSLGAFDSEGNILTDYTYTTKPFYGSSSDDEAIVNVTHIMYITASCHEFYGLYKVQLDRISTTIMHTLTGYTSSELLQEYTIDEYYEDLTPLHGRRTTLWPATGTYTYYPGDTGWYNPSSGNLGGFINTSSTVTVTNIDEPIHIDLTLYFESAEQFF